MPEGQEEEAAGSGASVSPAGMLGEQQPHVFRGRVEFSLSHVSLNHNAGQPRACQWTAKERFNENVMSCNDVVLRMVFKHSKKRK